MSNTNEQSIPLDVLEEIRKRDADSASTWFREPPLGACGRAFIDRRLLLRRIDEQQREIARLGGRLVAAAPDLLTLAKQYASECAECGGSGMDSLGLLGCLDCEDIRAAITKATGE